MAGISPRMLVRAPPRPRGCGPRRAHRHPLQPPHGRVPPDREGPAARPDHRGDARLRQTARLGAGGPRSPLTESAPYPSGRAAKSRLTRRYHPMPAKRVLPPPFISFEGRPVRLITSRDHLIEMLVLGLDHLVGALSLMGQITRSTQLPARHRLHGSHFVLWVVRRRAQLLNRTNGWARNRQSAEP